MTGYGFQTGPDMRQEAVQFHSVVLIALLIMSGCVGEAVVPVSDLTTAKSRYAARVIRTGDTLYLIAWESGLDYRELADWNNLVAPYRLRPGNRIYLTAPQRQQDGSRYEFNEADNMLPTGSELVVSVEENVAIEPVIINPDTGKMNVSKISQVGAWQWPAAGHIIQSFTGRDGNNGLDISGAEGSPIRAAARGIVVYAGSGLRGYGELLIIQHNEEFLSAYAHNRVLLVEEGLTVEMGQIVAEMGNTDAKTTRLHFEIRRDGKPVNPLKYLPRPSS